jgi:hypothetical protein
MDIGITPNHFMDQENILSSEVKNPSQRVNFNPNFMQLGVTQLAVPSFPCHHDSRSNPTPARGGQANEPTQVR